MPALRTPLILRSGIPMPPYSMGMGREGQVVQPKQQENDGMP